MSALDGILDAVKDYTASKVELYASDIPFEAFAAASSEELMLRTDPGNPVETRYMDGSREGGFLFSWYAKSADSETARRQLNAIIQALDLPEMTDITDVLEVKIEPIAGPSFVTKYESGEAIFVASFRLDYYIGR